MSTLYELTGEWAALQERADAGEDVTEALAKIDVSLEEKAARIHAVLRNLKADQEALAAEEKRLATKRKARERSEEELREYLRSNMERCGITRIRAPGFSLALSERTTLVVVDESQVPEEYKRTRTEVVLDRKALHDAVRNHGEIVPGVRLEPTTILTVR